MDDRRVGSRAPFSGASGRVVAHAALSCDSADDLGAAVASSVGAALDEGLPVTMYADPAASHDLACALGRQAERVTFALRPVGDTTRLAIPWADAGTAPRQPDVAALLGDAGRRERVDGTEDRINVMLADRPVTVLCAQVRGPEADARHRRFLEGHPHLLDGAGARVNPAFARPPRLSLLPAFGWNGRHVRRVAFRREEDLREVRRVATTALTDGSATPDTTDTAVLAVHEAALAALAVAGAGPEPCVLDVWAAPRALVLDLSAPPDVRPDWDRPMRLVDRLALSTAVRLDVGARLVRVVVPR